MVIPVDCAFDVVIHTCVTVTVCWYIPSVGMLVIGNGVLVVGDSVGVPVDSNR